GVTLPNIVWLKKYVERKEFFTEKDGVYQVILPFSTDASRITDAKTITVESGKDNITLTVKPVTKTEGLVPDSENTAFVPASLLAYFYASQNGNAVYETQKKIFIQKAVEPEITNFRCYAKTIYNVGKAIDYLRQEKHYGVQDGNRQQIDELSKRINELWLAVAVIGITVFLFGLITVFCVLLDSTDRKRGTIGILRVMGVSKFGVFYIIFLRSMSIGVISVFVTIALGFGLQLLLSYEWDLLFIRLPSVYLVFRWFDILILTAGELIVCFVGTLPPAYKASKLDPFAAVYN
ncbi:MAG: FtsX-like permease family protein, partial [Planctomycetaceae bacterium]|nr:FtsX-like permease family protein [Planctomycetaceae bacterium]